IITQLRTFYHSTSSARSYTRHASPLYVEVFWQPECELRVKDYRFVSYLTAIAIWPVPLALIGLSVGVAFFTRCRVMGAVLVVLFMLVVITACQFQRYM
ncbi:hypothetical protein, partial [Klebsiella pneumoniae]|uniref:hypothetical protein n=1 Tax=Klebsiella pneumoniae TaxID=573 RepID=UPI001D0E2B52